mmetsp:Transcript_97980/g.153227  ORF Transcript_97980/g.153227 Transcript_97980/m.153227 type:complete len:145 (-) Transcript_97980:898-1332(-)
MFICSFGACCAGMCVQAIAEVVAALCRWASSHCFSTVLSHSISVHDSDLLDTYSKERTILLLPMLERLAAMLNSFLLGVLERPPRNLLVGILGQAFIVVLCDRPADVRLYFIRGYSWVHVCSQVDEPFVWRETELQRRPHCRSR